MCALKHFMLGGHNRRRITADDIKLTRHGNVQRDRQVLMDRQINQWYTISRFNMRQYLA